MWIALIAVLLGLLLPAVQEARESAARAQCTNNLRQIGLALHRFHDVHRVFPASGWTRPGPGNPAGKFVGWRPLVLAYIEQRDLQKLYNFKLDWWEGTNAVVAAVPVRAFQCPSVPQRRDVTSAVAKSPRLAMLFSSPLAPTDYEAIMGVKPASINPHLAAPLYDAGNRFSVMHRNSQTRLAQITDGTSSTITVVECAARPLVYRNRAPRWELANDQGIGWADSEGPFSLDGASADGSNEGCAVAGNCEFAMNKRNDNEPFSFHLGGGNVLFADSHVEFVHESIALPVFAAQCTMSAGEVAGSVSQ